MTDTSDTDDQRVDTEQSTPERIMTPREFYREKFAAEDADEDAELGPFIDPKGDDIDEMST